MILHVTVKKQICNVAFVNVKRIVILNNVFISIVIVPKKFALGWERT